MVNCPCQWTTEFVILEKRNKIQKMGEYSESKRKWKQQKFGVVANHWNCLMNYILLLFIYLYL